jgi:hypothetical protein
VSSDQTARIESFLKSLPKSKSGDLTPIEPGADPIEEFVLSLLLWEAPRTKATRALERINHHVVDYNELRISLPDEMQLVLGERYPRCQERSFFIQKSLNGIFQTQNAVSLRALETMPKREARKYLESLPGTPIFVSARVMLVALKGHAVPIDDRMLEKLIKDGVLDEGVDLKKATSLFERAVKAGDSEALHGAMLKWIEKKPSRTSTRKKTTAKKTSTSRSKKK